MGSSYQFLNHSNKVRDSPSCSSSANIRHGFSKSQMCLHKILRIIASYPPHHISQQSSRVHQIQEFAGKRLVGIDLNMELCQADQESESLLSACCIVDDDDNNNKDLSNNSPEKSSSEGECDPVIQEVEKESEEMNLEIQEIAKQEENEKEQKQEFQEKGKKTNDCLSILIEAADMVSGKSKNKEENKTTSSQTLNESESDGGALSKSPVVVARSKRGRNHVLPSRYRDSVILEPWKRLQRPQRTVAAATPSPPPPPPPPLPMVSTKRGKN